jgi:hypothetical protein
MLTIENINNLVGRKVNIHGFVRTVKNVSEEKNKRKNGTLMDGTDYYSIRFDAIGPNSWDREFEVRLVRERNNDYLYPMFVMGLQRVSETPISITLLGSEHYFIRELQLCIGKARTFWIQNNKT